MCRVARRWTLDKSRPQKISAQTESETANEIRISDLSSCLYVFNKPSQNQLSSTLKRAEVRSFAYVFNAWSSSLRAGTVDIGRWKPWLMATNSFRVRSMILHCRLRTVQYRNFNCTVAPIQGFLKHTVLLSCIIQWRFSVFLVVLLLFEYKIWTWNVFFPHIDPEFSKKPICRTFFQNVACPPFLITDPCNQLCISSAVTCYEDLIFCQNIFTVRDIWSFGILKILETLHSLILLFIVCTRYFEQNN